MPSAAQPQPHPWHFLIAVDLSNFGSLRRRLGRARAGRLAIDAQERIATLLQIDVQIVSRSTLEIEFSGLGSDQLDQTLDAIEGAFARSFDIDGESHLLRIALAAVASPIGLTDDIGLAEAVDEALEQARREHRRVVRDLSQDADPVDRVAIQRELAAAIDGGEMFLQYQPKVHVRRQVIDSAEALIRWDHPVRGLILPNDFIALTEEANLIGKLTLWTIGKVIADQQMLRDQGFDLTIFVNISGQSLDDADFIDTACRLIKDRQAKIGFEITETSMIRDSDSAIAHLTRIAAAGIPIAIDDYGAGLSSLAYLKKLPATELKIDKMFVMELTSSNRDPLIVRSTIDLAHAMEMEVTAEGVETPAAMALLSVMGCDIVQGFLISRPLLIGAFLAFLQDHAAQPMDMSSLSLRRPASFWKAA